MRIFEAKDASKKIDGVTIINEISLSISKGEKIAITGRNGSGKSSLLKLIGGIYEATSGELMRFKTNISYSYVPEHFPENIRFLITDYLLLMGKMAGKKDEEIQMSIREYAEIFAIQDFLNTPLRKCSKGTKQKVGIIQALLKEPDLLLLDEPLTGLDDKAQFELLNQLNSLSNDTTIVFTVHDQLLIDGLAERLLIVEGGKIISDSTKIKKEKLRIIKAFVPTKQILTQIPSTEYKFVEENLVEILVPDYESDRVLSMLLNEGSSILELLEKR